MNTKTVAETLLSTVLSFTLLTSPSAAAAPTWAKLAVSRDGQTWMTDVRLPLFDKDVVLAPGDVVARPFYARNQSGQDAELSVGVNVTDPSGWLRTHSLRIAVLVKGTWVQVNQVGGQRMARFVVTAGDVSRFTVRVQLASGSVKSAMDRHLRFSVRLRLSQVVKGARA